MKINSILIATIITTIICFAEDCNNRPPVIENKNNEELNNESNKQNKSLSTDTEKSNNFLSQDNYPQNQEHLQNPSLNEWPPVDPSLEKK